jgi:hypothetical protein
MNMVTHDRTGNDDPSTVPSSFLELGAKYFRLFRRESDGLSDEIFRCNLAQS